MPGPMHPGARPAYSADDDGDSYELRPPGAVSLYDLRVDVKVVDWRMDCFVEYGFSLLDAGLLAQRRDVDRVHVKRLLDAGATHTQVRDLVL